MDPPPLPFSATDRCPYVDIWSLAFPPGSAAARADFILTDCPPNTQLEALLNTQESMPPDSRNLAHPALVSAVRSGVPINLKLRSAAPLSHPRANFCASVHLIFFKPDSGPWLSPAGPPRRRPS
jgi:hypothetical protein